MIAGLPVNDRNNDNDMESALRRMLDDDDTPNPDQRRNDGSLRAPPGFDFDMFAQTSDPKLPSGIISEPQSFAGLGMECDTAHGANMDMVGSGVNLGVRDDTLSGLGGIIDSNTMMRSESFPLSMDIGGNVPPMTREIITRHTKQKSGRGTFGGPSEDLDSMSTTSDGRHSSDESGHGSIENVSSGAMDGEVGSRNARRKGKCTLVNPVKVPNIDCLHDDNVRDLGQKLVRVMSEEEKVVWRAFLDFRKAVKKSQMDADSSQPPPIAAAAAAAAAAAKSPLGPALNGLATLPVVSPDTVPAPGAVLVPSSQQHAHHRQGTETAASNAVALVPPSASMTTGASPSSMLAVTYAQNEAFRTKFGHFLKEHGGVVLNTALVVLWPKIYENEEWRPGILFGAKLRPLVESNSDLFEFAGEGHDMSVRIKPSVPKVRALKPPVEVTPQQNERFRTAFTRLLEAHRGRVPLGDLVRLWPRMFNGEPFRPLQLFGAKMRTLIDANLDIYEKRGEGHEMTVELKNGVSPASAMRTHTHSTHTDRIVKESYGDLDRVSPRNGAEADGGVYDGMPDLIANVSATVISNEHGNYGEDDKSKGSSRPHQQYHVNSGNHDDSGMPQLIPHRAGSHTPGRLSSGNVTNPKGAPAAVNNNTHTSKTKQPSMESLSRNKAVPDGARRALSASAAGAHKGEPAPVGSTSGAAVYGKQSKNRGVISKNLDSYSSKVDSPVTTNGDTPPIHPADDSLDMPPLLTAAQRRVMSSAPPVAIPTLSVQSAVASHLSTDNVGSGGWGRVPVADATWRPSAGTFVAQTASNSDNGLNPSSADLNTSGVDVSNTVSRSLWDLPVQRPTFVPEDEPGVGGPSSVMESPREGDTHNDADVWFEMGHGREDTKFMPKKGGKGRKNV